ncbi:hypothetical protein [Streptomyces sp. NBC_00648]|uniref:hypothetical protein n=1 Tax=Streptomyces sp. NBC_00648 TaxID=2975797 RepID=UPI003245487F
MPVPEPNVYRHDRKSRALSTLAGEIDLLHVLPAPPNPTGPRPGAVSRQPVPAAIAGAGGVR